MLSCLSFAIFSPRPSVCAIFYAFYNYGQYLSQNAPLTRKIPKYLRTTEGSMKTSLAVGTVQTVGK